MAKRATKGRTGDNGTAYDARVTQAGQYSDVPVYGMPDSAYAAPSINEDAPYTDTFGWGPKTSISVENTPDAMRNFRAPVRDVHPADPHAFYRSKDADEKARESVTDQDADGWTIQKRRYQAGPDPRWNPPVETRLTESMGQRRYSFTRPFDQLQKGTGKRQLNGMHFSMADHRRDYDILGMKPWSQHRNTYRVDPAPWDADMYDVPPESTTSVYLHSRVQAVDVPDSANRAYRL